jgi:hypothetical protein
MPKIPKVCPSCSSRLIVTQLTCPECGTEVKGKYDPDLFSRLSPDDYDFIVLFLKTKGNIKEMERELGISYWTIRSKLSEVLGQLGLEESPEPGSVTDKRQQILEQLNKGMISAKEAAQLLEKTKAESKRSVQ